MLVYGDQETTVQTTTVLAEVRRQAVALGGTSRGIEWHQACVALFIAASGLLQGVADAEFAAAACDTLSVPQAKLMAALREAAHAIDRSWSSGFADQNVPDLRGLDALDADSLPVELTIRRCEGYAYYALYPEQYLAAARKLPRGACVIGLRSIGAGLAAVVASACDAVFVCTLRPIGDVYARCVAVSVELEAAIRTHRDAVFALVDEGPGQSGSSLGGVADYLETIGVARERIVFLPSHAGDLGGNAQPRHRHRWQAAMRLTFGFEDLCVSPAGHSLSTWFEDVTGPAIVPLRDISGGHWRNESRYVAASADPGREARKYLLTTTSGTYLLKFIGLDAEAAGKFARARRLHEAGFTPEPIALRHGFLAERWLPVEHTATNTQIWSVIAPYLALRAGAFPARGPGASLAELMAAARYNLGQALGPETNVLFDSWPAERLALLQQSVRPVYIDGRMHRWEWIACHSGIFKTDAIDHAQAHDLVGCQDIAWDVAGAVVELGASAAQRDKLVHSVMAGRKEAASLTALSTLCYLGFQIGWWHFASEADSALRQQRYYADQVKVLLRVL